jgi:hypothetical protein
MKTRHAIARLIGVMLAFLVLALAEPVRAQIPETEEAFVYGINATTPGEVFGTFSPPQVEEIFILAGRVSILSPRRTRVFYWPITREYRPAWSQLNEPLDGVLEIMQRGRVIRTVTSQPYTVHFEAVGTTVGQLYVGHEAVAAEAQLLDSRDAYQQAVHDYKQAHEEWLAQVRAAQQPESAKRQLPPGTELPPEPQPPPALQTYTVGLHQGFPMALETGEYRIRTRQPDGEVVRGSERTLHVFEPRRSALGYEVIPEERWTFPEQVNALTDVILAKAGSVVYLRPRLAREYPALAYERLRNAQYAGDASTEWHWVAEEDDQTFADTDLEIVRDGVVVERVAKASFFVSQAFNQELGYEILPFDPLTPDLTPRVDFAGYRIKLHPGRDSFAVRLKPQAGAPYADSTRQVRVMPDGLPPILVPTALFATALGLAPLVLRHRLSRLRGA